MGLFGKQLLEVIEWKDDSKDTIVYRYEMPKKKEIMNSSTLVVRPGQVAVFVHKGQVADVFESGSYKLLTENIPFLTKMLSLPTGFNSPIKAEVYFVNTKRFTGLKWGTSNPIMMRDADFGTIRLRGFGIYSFKISDARKFMEEVFSTNAVFKVSDIEENNKPLIIQGITDTIAESKVSALDLATQYKEFSDTVTKYTNQEFEKLGMELCQVVIENLSLPEEVEKALDERTRLGVIEDKIGTYTRLKTADAIGDAAKNPNGGNLAGLGVGFGAGRAIGGLFADGLNYENPERKTKSVETKVCPECKATIPATSKFCPECGKKFPAQSFCSKCGAKLEDGAKFCSECGEKVNK